ncbi:hypothetical protein UFOVP273_129 [uncultured Caudovirales phage]|uniref:Uncharacterized protein n=1 Tax=uncultured Caudovirales phage TaxID=2100421 RepID=A0A6J5LNC4_9CAUD|nr:hypothetical protein UFOVP273_129 [uncultured Caudovirales phage]
MATEKTPNYTAEATAKIVEAYKANPTKETVAALAVEFNKTERSIIAKLSREGVYKAKEYKTKTGETPVKKDETADKIGTLVGLSDGEVDSLTKANKTALVKILAALTPATVEAADVVEAE